jgi:hypothetical protein
MGLTGSGFIVLLIGGALAAVVACVRLLPRYSGQVLARTGLVVGTQVALLLALLVVVNSSMRFYSTWGDLVGSGTGTVRIFDRSSGSPPPAPSARPSQDALTRRLPAGEGRLNALAIRGTRSGISTRVYVYAPPQYGHGRRFPVVLVLASPREMIVRQGLPQLAAREIAAGRLRPTLLVIASPGAGCVDAPGGRQAETFFTQDLPAAIGVAYHVSGAPSGWSVIGPNAAGYCAALLAMRHSDRFGSAVFAAGALTPPRGDLYGGSPAIRDEYDPRWRLRHRPPPPISVGVVGDDGFGAAARPPMRVFPLPADAWQRDLPAVLRWVSAHLEPGDLAVTGKGRRA